MSRDALTLAGAAGLAAVATVAAGAETSAAARLLAVMALPALLSPLVGTIRLADLPAHLLAWGLATLALAATTWMVAGGWSLTHSAAPALVAFCIVATTRLAAIVTATVLRELGTDEPVAGEWARWLSAAFLWLLAATPLWLGPLADLQARGAPAVVEAIVAASPLVHVGVAAGQDLLRTQWFYAHSSLGSLQFDYPPLRAVALGYLCIATALALALVAVRRARRAGRVGQNPSSNA